MKKTVTVLGCFLTAIAAANATVIATDSFVADAVGDAAGGIYKHGDGVATAGILKNSPNNNVVATGFAGNWAGSGYATVQPGSGSDGHANIRMQSTVSAYRSLADYSSNAANTYYFSMTVSADALLSGSQNAYFGFANDLTSLPGEGITKYGFLLGIEGTGSGMNLIARTRQSDSSPSANRLADTVVTSISAGQEYDLLVRVDRSGTGGFARDQFTLWINPDDAVEGGNAAALVFDDSSSSAYVGFLNNDSINSFGMYSGGVDAGNIANVTVDNVMMATTFDDVYSNVVPEPATLGLFAISSAMILIGRKMFNE